MGLAHVQPACLRGFVPENAQIQFGRVSGSAKSNAGFPGNALSMLRRGWKLALCAVAAVWLAGCARPAPAEIPRGPGPALWLLADADTRIWLFGSVHILGENVDWQRKEIRQALGAAKVLYLETPVDEEGAGAIAQHVARLGVLPPGSSLDSLLTPAQRKALAQTTRAYGLDAAQMQRLRPWLAALQISLAAASAQGQNAQSGVEQVLLSQARANGQELRYFETALEQVQIFADLPQEAQLRFLDVTLAQLKDSAELLRRMDDLWLEGDVVGLGRVLDADFDRAGPQIRTALIDARNARWAITIGQMLDQPGEVFVAVGAGHLTGRGNVIALLEAQGHRIERR